jgi:hypothetical protein
MISKNMEYAMLETRPPPMWGSPLLLGDEAVDEEANDDGRDDERKRLHDLGSLSARA